MFKDEEDFSRPKDKRYTSQHDAEVTGKTLPTLMQENGDTHIDVLKIDLEGGEYGVLQDVFDRVGCPPASQITIQYHNFDLDERYGTSAQLNTIHNLLNACGFRSFKTRDHWRAAV